MNKPINCGCGGEVWAFMTLYPENPERPYICQCRNCFTRTGGYPTEAEAIEAWNRAMGVRTAKVITAEKPIEGSDRTIIAIAACGNCGIVVSIFDNYCAGCGARLEWK